MVITHLQTSRWSEGARIGRKQHFGASSSAPIHDTNNHHHGEFYQYKCHCECYSLVCLHLISGIREGIEKKYHLRGKIIKNTPFLQINCNDVISEIISAYCLVLSSLSQYQLSQPSFKVPRTVALLGFERLLLPEPAVNDCSPPVPVD